MKTCGIYKITNIINHKLFIGQSVNIKKRWNEHRYLLNKNICNNIHLQRAWNKYGRDNFKFEIISVISKETLNKEETRLIKKHKSSNREFGYNITNGGDSHLCSEETKKRISKAKTGRGLGRRHSEETKLKMSEAQKGSKNHRYGKKMPKRLKIRLSKRLKGIKFSEEHKRKISEACMGRRINIGRKATNQQKRNMSNAQKERRSKEKLLSHNPSPS